MKRLSLLFSILLSVLIMSCSKEDDEKLYERELIESDTTITESDEMLGCRSVLMDLDMSDIKYPVEILPKGGDNNKYFYMIEIPREGAELTLILEDNSFQLSDISVGSFKSIVRDYDDFSWWQNVNPYWEKGYEIVDDHYRFYKYESEIGYFEHTEFSKLQCKIPKSEEKENKAISIYLLTPDVRGCVVIFVQKSEIL